MFALILIIVFILMGISILKTLPGLVTAMAKNSLGANLVILGVMTAGVLWLASILW